MGFTFLPFFLSFLFLSLNRQYWLPPFLSLFAFLTSSPGFVQLINASQPEGGRKATPATLNAVLRLVLHACAAGLASCFYFHFDKKINDVCVCLETVDGPGAVAKFTGTVADASPATKVALLRFLADQAVTNPAVRAAMEVWVDFCCKNKE